MSRLAHIFILLILAFSPIPYAQAEEAQNPLVIPPPLEGRPPQSSVFYTKPVEQYHFETEQIILQKADGEELTFEVEVALTPTQQARGLMFRTEMDDNKGMLFVFNDVDMRSFWMKNTLIPLDMVFLDADGTVRHIHQNAKPRDLTGIKSKYPAKAVLELKGGATERMGIKEGDKVIHPYFRPLNGAQ